MTKQADPNSKRSLKRKARNFIASRPNRRATKRLNSALGAYKSGDSGSNQPGAQKYW